MTKNPIAIVGSLPNKSDEKIVGSYNGPGSKIVDDAAALNIAINIVMNITCDHFKVAREELIQKKGSKRNNAHGPAKRFFYVACMTSVKRIFPKSMSYVRAAAELGADHSTAMFHVKAHNGLLDVSREYRDSFGRMIESVEMALDNSSTPVIIAKRNETIEWIRALHTKLKTIDATLRIKGIDPSKLKPQITII